MTSLLTTPFGLGDLAFYVFRPFAYANDFIWGTDLRHCDLCKERRRKWNLVFSLPRYQWWLAIAAVAILYMVV